METIFSNCGELSIGDEIKFDYPSGVKSGKITSIKTGINYIALSVYHADHTGAYTLTVPHYNVLERINASPKKEDAVEEIKKPTRYNKRGKLECWDVILDQEMNFLEGNVLKYLWRYKEKNGIEDLKKARVYLDKLILESEKNKS